MNDEKQVPAGMDCHECGEVFDSETCCVNDVSKYTLARKSEVENLRTLLDLGESRLGLEPLPPPPHYSEPRFADRLERVLTAGSVREGASGLLAAEDLLGIENDSPMLEGRVARVVRALRDRLEETERTLRQEMAAQNTAIRELETEARAHFSGSPPERLRQLVHYYEHVAIATLEGAKTFRDDVVVQLRAMSLVVDMTGSAHTHAEKGARLRGLSELLEGGIAKLREMRFDLVQGRWWPDVLRSDYPTHELIKRNRYLEDRVAHLESNLEAAQGIENPKGGSRCRSCSRRLAAPERDFCADCGETVKPDGTLIDLPF